MTLNQAEMNHVQEFRKRQRRHAIIVILAVLVTYALAKLWIDGSIDFYVPPGTRKLLKTILVPVFYIGLFVIAYRNYRCPKCKASLLLVSFSPEACPKCRLPLILHPTDANEQVFEDRFASLSSGRGYNSGRLKVTSRRLLFLPNQINLSLIPTEIPFSEIVEIRNCRTMLFIPDGLSIRMKDGTLHTIKCFRRDHLQRRIEFARSRATP